MDQLIKSTFKKHDDHFRILCCKSESSIKERNLIKATKITLEPKSNSNYYLIEDKDQNISSHLLIKDTFKDLLNGTSAGYRHVKLYIYDQSFANRNKFQLNQEVIDNYFTTVNNEPVLSLNGIAL